MAITNITVKKSDGTTNVVFAALVQASGDGAPFIWQDAASHTVAKYRKTINGLVKYNGPHTARRVVLESVFPYTTVDVNKGSIPVYVNKGILGISGVKPEDLPQALWDEQVDQFVNFLASPEGRALLKSTIV